ncbi:MAG: hypothetical protein ABH844_07475 [Candidatus Omnitrophota bacterium]
MRLYKIVFTGIFVTIIAMVLVHQRVEIVKQGYVSQKNGNVLSSLIDQNKGLTYNLSKIESPSHLLASLGAEEIEFAKYRTRQTNICPSRRLNPDIGGTSGGFMGKLLDVFTLNAEARPQD